MRNQEAEREREREGGCELELYWLKQMEERW